MVFYDLLFRSATAFAFLSITSAFSVISSDDQWNGKLKHGSNGSDAPYASIDTDEFYRPILSPVVILSGAGKYTPISGDENTKERKEKNEKSVKLEAEYLLARDSKLNHGDSLNEMLNFEDIESLANDVLLKLKSRKRHSTSGRQNKHKNLKSSEGQHQKEEETDFEDEITNEDGDIDDFKSELEKDYVHVARSTNGFIRRLRRPMTSSASTGSLRAVVDLLVVVDNALYRRALQRHNNKANEAVQDIKKYYGFVTAVVDSRYSQIKDPDLSIRIRLAGIYIAQDRSDSPWSEKHVHALKHSMVLDPNVGLEKFQEWLKENHRKLPKFDHAVGFTGYSLVTSSGKHTSGMAYIGTVCKISEGYACSIVQEDGGLSSVSTVVHELGHGLGANHDGEETNADCPASQNYVMASANSPGKQFLKNSFLFSPCTLRQLKAVLRTEASDCLFDSSPDKISILPGESISPNDQCKDVFGHESGLCEIEDLQSPDEICSQLWCIKPGKPDSCVTRGHLTAVLGTPCDTGKVCKNGECLDRNQVLESFKESGSSGTKSGQASNRISSVPKPHTHQGSTEKPMKIELGRPKCKEDTSPEYCRLNVYQRPDLCQRRDMAAYCCFSCSFV